MNLKVLQSSFEQQYSGPQQTIFYDSTGNSQTAKISKVAVKSSSKLSDASIGNLIQIQKQRQLSNQMSNNAQYLQFRSKSLKSQAI